MPVAVRWTTVSTFGILAAAAGVALMLPDALPEVRATGGGGGGANTVSLTGIIRDFSSSHADFAVVPDGGYGHYAGNVAESLDVRGLPVLKDGEPVTDFEIDDQLVTPGRDFAIEVRVLGAAIQNGSYDNPVTMKVMVGDDATVPFGAFDNAVDGNVNDVQAITGSANPGVNPRQQVVATQYAAGTPIVVVGRSWNHSNSGSGSGSFTTAGNWNVAMEVSSEDDSVQLRVLRDGDPVPNIDGAYDQGNVESFVADYVDSDAGTMRLGDNQIIYLFELGVSGNDSGADFQDLVVLVTLASSAGYFEEDEIYGGGSGGGTGYKVATEWTDSAGRNIAPHLYTPALSNAATLEVRVIEDEDDAEESGSGSMSLGSGDLELGEDSGAQLVGMRFRDMQIPQGATIDAAYLQFQVDETDSGLANLRIRGEDTNNSSVFTSSSGNVSGRAMTSTSMDWSPGAWATVGAAGQTQRTPDLSAIIQEIVDRDGWVPGNAMSLIIDGSGTRTAESRDGSTSGAPMLHVEYSQSTVTLDAAGDPIADIAGAAGTSDNGGISSSESFDDWFSDRPGVNLSANHMIVLENDGNGTYEYITNAFHPIDRKLLLNQGDTHNRNFTYSIQTEFAYNAGGGQFFEFAGSDDTWVYVGGDLVIDLGGVGTGVSQYVNMDRLGLTDGEVYQLHFFHAQRGAEADFSLRTNIVFGASFGNAVVTGGFD